MNSISFYLKYANLQMAAEALYELENKGPGVIFQGDFEPAMLIKGNDRSSKFTTIQADAIIADNWTVLEHIGNTTTGFSGTLFLNTLTKERVLSFRSTEFADDSARDSEATNTLEIKEHGWAFGQISDMHTWVQSLYTRGLILVEFPLTVTGYSLGGHLATAFNFLYPGAAAATYTFNGAGVGTVAAGSSLTQVIQEFAARRSTGANADMFSDSLALDRYRQLSWLFREGSTTTLASIKTAIADLSGVILESPEVGVIIKALVNMRQIVDEAERIQRGLPSGSDAPPAKPIRTQDIAAAALDYQIAVM